VEGAFADAFKTRHDGDDFGQACGIHHHVVVDAGVTGALRVADVDERDGELAGVDEIRKPLFGDQARKLFIQIGIGTGLGGGERQRNGEQSGGTAQAGGKHPLIMPAEGGLSPVNPVGRLI
jgi:hypothetical protein